MKQIAYSKDLDSGSVLTKRDVNAPHICFIIVNISVVGGAERQLLQLLAHRPDYMRNVRLSLISFNAKDEGFQPEVFRDLNIEHIVIARSRHSQASFFYQLWSTLRRLKPDIVHTFMTGSAGNWGRLTAWLNRVPHIFHSDRKLDPPIKKSRTTLRPFLDAKTERFFPNAEATADWLVSMGIERERITVNPNGIRFERFQPEQTASLRTSWGLAEDEVVAGFLGKFRPEKRLDLLLDAVTALPINERPDKLVLGGEGKEMEAVKAQIEADAWLREHCVLLGLVRDVPGFMASIDYLILCSDYEGMPNVVLEAMAMGKPIVATRVSDVPQIIDGVGFLTECGDVMGLARAIQAMTALPKEERRKLGQRGRERVLRTREAKLTAETFWQAHLAALEGGPG